MDGSGIVCVTPNVALDRTLLVEGFTAAALEPVGSRFDRHAFERLLERVSVSTPAA